MERLQSLGQFAELPFARERCRLLPSRLLPADCRERRPRIHRRDPLIEKQAFRLGCEAAGGDRLLQCCVPCQKLGGAFRPDTARARQLVGGVAAQCDEIRYLSRLDAVARAQLGRTDACHYPGAHGMQNRRLLAGELERIAVAAGDDRAPIAALFFTRGRSSEEIVRFVTRRFGVNETAGGDEIREDIELLDQLFVEVPAALIIREQFLAVCRGAQRVPADEHRARALAFVESDEKIGEADDRAGSLLPLRRIVFGNAWYERWTKESPSMTRRGGGVLFVLRIATGCRYCSNASAAYHEGKSRCRPYRSIHSLRPGSSLRLH